MEPEGAGVFHGSHSTMWVIVTFLLGSADGFSPFRDTGESNPEGAINALWKRGVVDACLDGAQYCPARDTTPAEVTTFIVQSSVRLNPIPGSPCADVTRGAVHSDIINILAAAGVPLGCTTDRYCTRANVTRAQIANFLARAFPLDIGPRRCAPFTTPVSQLPPSSGHS